MGLRLLLDKSSHTYLLYSSSHPSHVMNSIAYSQFLRLRRLCSDDSDFSNKSEFMCQFCEKRGCPTSVVQTGHHRAQQIDRQSTPQTSQKEKNDRIPSSLELSNARARCKICPFIRNAEKISGPTCKRSLRITEKLYIVETGRRLGNRFRENRCDVEKDDKDASKPVARQLNLPNHTKQRMSVCGFHYI